MKIKFSKDKKFRYGRRVIVKVSQGVWAYKTTGRLVVETK